MFGYNLAALDLVNTAWLFVVEIFQKLNKIC
jgi:hypothetical protein